MKNEQIVMQTRVNLMNLGVIGTTGRKMQWQDKEGNPIEINEPAEIHTVAGWNKAGYKVTAGQKCKVFIPIWNYITLDDGSQTMIQRNAPFFTPEQVELRDVATEAMEEMAFA